MSSPESSTTALSEIDSLELAILTELCSPEAVDAFEMMHANVRPTNAARFADLLSIINGLSDPNFAVDAPLNLLGLVPATVIRVNELDEGPDPRPDGTGWAPPGVGGAVRPRA
ncbi:hypothetical protein [Rhodococcus sp. 14-2470-1a]|uniref:hypothetical protein n=1 Tax=Rhodococcus sp. 14-2470-1a TaxID=2023150 RepID=UPI000B9B3104|nr:hypothetical protein [Rhodococcus sp. 14-2470-1a]OZF41311.1 hypothetical protein CH292_27825 [Rhodococcus sp. 14-2470-1a]OZF41372.1 hypothetical protein CH292_28160 [Rhodococcus sp. 14-2470-1a]